MTGPGGAQFPRKRYDQRPYDSVVDIGPPCMENWINDNNNVFSH